MEQNHELIADLPFFSFKLCIFHLDQWCHFTVYNILKFLIYLNRFKDLSEKTTYQAHKKFCN